MKRTAAISMALTLAIVCTTLSQDQRRLQQQRQAQSHQIFTLRGVEFTDEQQADVEELRKKFMPKLLDIQRKHGSIFTDDQRRAQRKAIQAAREAGKQGRVLVEAVEAAITLTDEQKETQTELRRERNDLFAQIQGELRSLLTDDQRKQLRPQGRSRRPGTPPTHPDVKYGPYDRNVMDVWLAESDKPTMDFVKKYLGVK